MIAKEAWKEYGKDFGAKSSLTAMYIFIIAVSLLLNILFPPTIILTIPFVVLPFTFAYQAALFGLQLSKFAIIKSFFAFYPFYFKVIFFGGFRALVGILKGILISLIVSSILTIILYYTFLRGQPGFAEILQEIEAATSIKQMETAMEHFYKFSPANLMMQIVTLSGSVLGTFVFIRHCLLNSEKFYLNLMTNNPLPIKALNRLYLVASHIRRKEFFKEYYGAVWYVGLFFLIVFAAASTASVFIFKFEINRAIFIGLFVSLFLLFPFIPYYFSVLKMISFASGDDYSKASIHLTEKALTNLTLTNKLTPEEREKIEEELAKEKENLERILKDSDESNPPETDSDEKDKK